jgi:hypothetical protein
MLKLFAAPALCKQCVHYNANDKTCERSIVAKSKSKVFHDFAKIVRNDPKRCGVEAIWFQEKGDI